MGGRAFDLRTPPIPHHIYLRLVSKYTSLLEALYQVVRVAPHAPGKVTHGDIDILVASPIRPFTNAELSAVLGAETHQAGFPTMSFAVHEPEMNAYVQLDIYTSSPEKIDWQVFHRAYGDLWNILGAMGTRLGISVNHTGVRLAVEQIEKANKKASLLHLTDDPRAAIEFFGCEWERYQRGFRTEEELFEYCSDCRFLGVDIKQRKNGAAVGSKRLKDLRPLCAKWIDEYLPKLMEKETQFEVISRETVREQALESFGKRLGYEMLVGRWEKDIFDKEMWNNIRQLLPISSKRRNIVVRVLVKRLEEDDLKNSEYGAESGSEEWGKQREAKWTGIALAEWRDILI